ncbi:MAG: 16S rRNA (cytosine(1402)-N(4))-methyltransferase RsmH [Saccharofermentanales bacterium]|jgi:16S rRNA (cytosine1402-N4)-methyltransferase|nr:16S rRNA (cytosine(1402)-N(4))-methyltransferase RsmH [Clostridiaceae bacterium]
MLREFSFSHQPVLMQPVLDLMNVFADGLYVDCTLGGGGHAAGLLSRLNSRGRLIAIDRDEDAMRAGSSRLASVDSQAAWQVVHGNFADLSQIMAQLGLDGADGILADFGVSSWQFDQAGRGFGYRQEGPLDMRMDRDSGQTAADVVNTYSEKELTRIFRQYGEERHAGKIARAIVNRRADTPFVTTTDLAEVVRQAMPAGSRQEAQHPARRVFQAIRIEVNQELDAIEQLLAVAPRWLRPGGRLCMITFHSLEDRLVKEAFRKLEKPCTCPRDFPVCVCGQVAQGRVITRKAIIADEKERQENPRSRSAKLRCFEKNRQTA